MAKANKTQLTGESVNTFLETIEDAHKAKDCRRIIDLMQEISSSGPKMWGESIIGFGQYHYKYASGREGDSLIFGLSPRYSSITIYITPGFKDYDGTGQSEKLLEKLGKYKIGKACLYIKEVKDIDLKVLGALLTNSWKYMKEKYRV